MTKLLFLLPGPAAPVSDDRLNRFLHLSQVCEGDILLPVWFDSEEAARLKMGADSVPNRPSGDSATLFCIRSVITRSSDQSSPCCSFSAGVVHYSAAADTMPWCVRTSVTGLAGAILSRLLGVPLITEIPGVPDKAVISDSPIADGRSRLKKWLSDRDSQICRQFICRDLVLFPTQLPSSLRSCRAKKFVFHAFVPVSAIVPAKEQAEILLVGYPVVSEGRGTYFAEPFKR